MNYLIPVFVGAVIGYITNWLAIKMLFRPHYEKRIFNLRLPFTPGLIPKERGRIARSVGNTVGEYLLSPQIILDSISKEGNNDKLEKWILSNIRKLKENERSIKEIIGLSQEEFGNYQVALGDNLANYINSKIAIEGSGNPLGELIPEDIIIKLRSYIEKHKGNLVEEIRRALKTPKIKSKVKTMIEEIISKNSSRLLSVFVPVEIIADKIYSIIETYLYKPRIYEDISFFLNISLDKILEKEVAGKEVEKNIHSLIHKNLDKFINTPISNILVNVGEENMQKAAALSKSAFQWFAKNKLPAIVELFDVAKIIEEEILAFDVAFAEELILEIASKELRAITWLGALLGGTMGILMPFLSAFGI